LTIVLNLGYTVDTAFNRKNQIMVARYDEDRFEVGTYDANGSYVPGPSLTSIAARNQPLIAALNVGAEIVGLKQADMPPAWEVWKPGTADPDVILPLLDENGTLRNAVLSSDGGTLVVSQQEVNTLYRRGFWVGAFLVPWRM
jgi:hypothetical protein